MANLVAAYQVSAFITPANGTTIDADPVRGNDNTLRANLNGHDSDAGIHFQGSTLAERPVAGTTGRKWCTTDDRRVWIDDGASWQEIAYASTASPTFSGTITLAGTTIANTTLTAAASYTLTAPGTITLTASATTTVSSSTGAVNVSAGSGNSIFFQISGVSKWSINSTGQLLATTDNSYDIGAAGANRPRNVWAATNLTAGTGATASTLTSGQLTINGTQVLGASKLGWTTAPTGTLDRTTFISDSVTLASLAARVAALIVDLRNHGLIAP